MKRSVYEKLLAWKEDAGRKPLIVNGVRQCGKTWILKEFGRNEFRNTVYINCDKTVEMKTLFYDFDTSRLLRAFSALTEESITPGETLIFLDEIQEVPSAITSLKYFAEDAPAYHIVVAGSLYSSTGFPVGKVDRINMYPMTFPEFLDAMGKSHLLSVLQSQKWDEISSLRASFVELLREYYFTGGMPEVVQSYASLGDVVRVREIQKRILQDYEDDFSKHIPPALLSKVRAVWTSLPSQLARENKKFIYGALKKGGRAKEYEDAIIWLMNAGLVYKVSRVRKIEKPLKFYEDLDAFKLFFCDLGLLGAASDVTAREVLLGENCFVEYKGAFTEEYCAQTLISSGEKTYYYSKDSSPLEIDFLIQREKLYAIEVKAEVNVKAKSLRVVKEDNSSVEAVRFSLLDYMDQGWMTNVPLYGLSEWVKGIE